MTALIDASLICNAIPVGGYDAYPYGLHPDYVSHGAAWIKAKIEAAEAIGCKSHFVHRPHGWMGRYNDQGMPMFDFDMVPNLRADPNPAFRKPIDTFAPIIGPIVARGNTVIAYYGGLLSPTLVNQKSPGLWDDWLRRIEQSVKPVLDARCKLAVDASALIKVTDIEWTMLQTLNNLTGNGLVVEGIPDATAVHFTGWNAQTGEAEWGRSGSMPREHLGPTVLRWLPLDQDRAGGETDDQYRARIAATLPGMVQNVLADHCTPLFQIEWANGIVPGIVGKPPEPTT